MCEALFEILDLHLAGSGDVCKALKQSYVIEICFHEFQFGGRVEDRIGVGEGGFWEICQDSHRNYTDVLVSVLRQWTRTKQAH